MVDVGARADVGEGLAGRLRYQGRRPIVLMSQSSCLKLVEVQVEASSRPPSVFELADQEE